MDGRKRPRPKIIESLARVCEQYPIDRKILVVQNHHAGQLILQSLARCSGGWLNLRAVTPAELAWDAIAAEALTLDDEESKALSAPYKPHPVLGHR